MDILLAARRSDLARLQAYQVGDQLTSLGCHVRYHFRESLGDINLNDPLWKMPEKGVFTQDFHEGLLKGEWDMVVHSWKDLPVEQDPRTEIAATLPRADARDLLLVKKKHRHRVQQSRRLQVFSSSPRRQYNLSPFLKNYYPGLLDEVEFHNVRGNIQTRVQKLLDDPERDGLVVAKAALDRLLSNPREEFAQTQKILRLALAQCDWMVLPLSLNPTAAAQGALAIEIRSDRQDLKSWLNQIHCEETAQTVREERRILKSYGGGCHQKIGVTQLMRPYGTLTFLRGETDQGETLNGMKWQSSHELSLHSPCLELPSFFQREPMDYVFPQYASGHWIARENAIPSDLQAKDFPAASLLWAAGLKTWQSLAQRGFWVHGSQESLGESEPLRLEVLCPELKWVKWTHKDSPVSSYFPNQVLTYRLSPSISSWKARHKEYFWMSGTQFKQALSLDPKVLQARHYCGPGHTYTIVQDVLKQHGIQQEPIIIPSFEIWKSLGKDKNQ